MIDVIGNGGRRRRLLAQNWRPNPTITTPPQSRIATQIGKSRRNTRKPSEPRYGSESETESRLLKEIILRMG